MYYLNIHFFPPFIFFSSERRRILYGEFVNKILVFFPGLCDICIWRPFGVCFSQLCLKVRRSEASQEKSPKAMGVRPLFIRSYPYGGCHASSGYIQQWRIFCDGKSFKTIFYTEILTRKRKVTMHYVVE